MPNDEVSASVASTENEQGASTSPNVENTAPKTFTEEEVAKMVQSASSKAKNEILKELGIGSVEQGKKVQTDKSELEQRVGNIESLLRKAEEKASREHEKALLADLGVSEAKRDSAVILAKARVGEGKDFDRALAEVIDENPAWKSPSKMEIGLKDVGAKAQGQTASSSGLRSKYSWLPKDI